MRIGIRVALIAVFLVGVAIGVIATWALRFAGGARVQVLEGYAWVNQEGTAIGLSPDQDTPGKGYVIAGAMWREQDGSWHDTFPTCLEPLTSDQRVRLGVLHAPPSGEAPGGPVVVWLECLE